VKYPFLKKSFWIILVALYLIIFLFPPSIESSGLGSGQMEWIFYFDIPAYYPLDIRTLIFEMIIAFLLNYLGHLIFSKPEKNKGCR